MKEKIKDRIDVLFEKAKAGDSDAQLKLARSFYNGHLVEKSIEQAKYWAFKSASAGNKSAQYYCSYLDKNKKEKFIADAVEYLGLSIILPYVEIAIGILGMIVCAIINYEDSIVFAGFGACLLIGVFSIPVSLWTGNIGENKGRYGFLIGTFIGILICNVIGVAIFIGAFM